MAELIDLLNTALAGRYAIQRELGAGGMATVFLAQDLKHHRPVAIKVLHPELAAALGPDRFLREIEIAARLNHPHILPLHDSGAADGLLYYVMPYAEGESLRQRLKREKQLPLGDALSIARETADALDYAHRHGVVHRDIKPENILFAEQHAVVADFGIARAIVAAGGEKLTATGLAIGTAAYMSPEQGLGSADLDGRSDLYSLGCVVYEMLSGQPPFTGPTPESLAHQHLNLTPRPVTELRPAVPEAIGRAIHSTLAKAAADRFRTAAEFAAAIAVSAQPGETGPRKRDGGQTADLAEPRDPKFAWARIRKWALAAMGILVALVAVAAWQRWGPPSGWSGGSSTAHVAKKDWILVAEFDGPPDDSSLAVTTRDLVSAALDQSAIVATVPPEQVRIGLQMAGKPAGARVDAEVAKELAYRGAIRTVVEGKIGRLGQGYSIVLRVVDAESLKVVLTESAIARDQDALIPTLGRLVEKLRARLGENRSAIEANRLPDGVSTSSFEAYRLYVQGLRLLGSGDSRAAIPVFREALALDPDFAYAWRRLGVAFSNMDQPDSGLAAFDEALRRARRLTVGQRLEVEAQRANNNGDLWAALAAFDRALQADSSAVFLSGRAFVLEGMGRLEEALECTRLAERRSPFGVPPFMRNNEIRQLNALGRVDEARAVARSSGQLTVSIEIQAGNWAVVERRSDSLLTSAALDEVSRVWSLLCLASAQSSRGAFKAAARTFESAEAVARARDLPKSFQKAPRRGRMMLAVASGGALPLPGDAWARDSSTMTLLTRGLRAAIAEDRPEAQRLLDAARARWANSPPELAWQGATPALLEARIAALAGHWEEAARILRPVAYQRVEYGTRIPGRAGMSTVRWFLADVFEQLGRPDSAAAILERVVSDPAPALMELNVRGLLLPFAHRRLVLLYARMGRIDEARQHWQIFTETVRTPDAEIGPLIAEARTALASAEGFAKSAKR